MNLELVKSWCSRDQLPQRRFHNQSRRTNGYSCNCALRSSLVGCVRSRLRTDPIGEQLNRNIEERIEEARQAGKSQEEIRRLREKLEDEAAFAEAYIAVKLARTLR